MDPEVARLSVQAMRRDVAVGDKLEDDSWEGFEVFLDALVGGRAEVLGQRLVDMLVCGAVKDADLPHVLVCTDSATGAVSITGPYPDGFSALCAAEADHVSERSQHAESSMVFSVMSLIPPGVSESAG